MEFSSSILFSDIESLIHLFMANIHPWTLGIVELITFYSPEAMMTGDKLNTDHRLYCPKIISNFSILVSDIAAFACLV